MISFDELHVYQWGTIQCFTLAGIKATKLYIFETGKDFLSFVMFLKTYIGGNINATTNKKDLY